MSAGLAAVRLTVANWRLAVATIIVLGYGYAIVGWPALFWLSTIITTISGVQFPAPPIVPWEQLVAATGTLAAIAGIDVARDRLVGAQEPGRLPDKVTQRL